MGKIRRKYTLAESRLRDTLSQRQKEKYAELSSGKELRQELYNSLIGDSDDAVRDILELCNEAKVSFTDILRKYFKFVENVSHYCLVKNPRNFIVITTFGAANVYEGAADEYKHEASSLYIWNLPSILRCLNIEMRNNAPTFIQDHASGLMFNFRSYQTLFLYIASMRDVDSSVSYRGALQVLWSSLPEPLLTRAEFLARCVDGDSQELHILTEAWDWYCMLVRNLEISEKCPRSLKHLSRCSIRNNLKDSFKLPNGIEELEIPWTLKQYLNLKDFNQIN